MKKILAVILAVAILLTAGTVCAFAARGSKGAGFVDKNKDGVCDNRVESSAFSDNDGDGICDNIRRNSGYTDEDGDGVCDNSSKLLECMAQSEDESTSVCKGEGFEDLDEDGVCDNYESGNRCNGMGKGAGKGSGRYNRGGCKGGNCKGCF